MDFSFLSKTTLFHGVSPEEAGEIIKCLGARRKHFSKGSVVCRVGDTAPEMGMVLSGSVHIESDDLWGNKSILGHVAVGQIFAEAYACIPGEPLIVSVVAAEESEVLFLNVAKLLKACQNACPHHSRIIRNLLAETARKNLNLSQKIAHTAPKSIRGRLISYLSSQVTRQGSRTFAIPFNRQQLADYLGVDRSALSAELSKMQKEGLLTVEKNRFCIKEME